MKIENTTVRGINLPMITGQMIVLAPGLNEVPETYFSKIADLPAVRAMFSPQRGEIEASLRFPGEPAPAEPPPAPPTRAVPASAPVVPAPQAPPPADAPSAPAGAWEGLPGLSVDPQAAREQISTCTDMETIMRWGRETTDRPDMQALLQVRFSQLNVH